jgi:FMN phosphatase YigB (HAD superfamily)
MPLIAPDLDGTLVDQASAARRWIRRTGLDKLVDGWVVSDAVGVAVGLRTRGSMTDPIRRGIARI